MTDVMTLSRLVTLTTTMTVFLVLLIILTSEGLVIGIVYKGTGDIDDLDINGTRII